MARVRASTLRSVMRPRSGPSSSAWILAPRSLLHAARELRIDYFLTRSWRLALSGWLSWRTRTGSPDGPDSGTRAAGALADARLSTPAAARPLVARRPSVWGKRLAVG